MQRHHYTAKYDETKSTWSDLSSVLPPFHPVLLFSMAGFAAKIEHFVEEFFDIWEVLKSSLPIGVATTHFNANTN